MKDVVITVLMTVYNGGHYLEKSVNSVLSQTYRDFEFLIINDCSTDQSLEFLQSIHDPRIKIFSNPHNIGQTRSLNVGLHLAQCKYIARIDADDAAFPEWLQQQLELIEQFPLCAVLSPAAILMNEKDEIMKVLKTPLTADDIIFKSLFASPINHVGALMNKEIVLAHGGYDESFKIVADYALWCKLLSHDQQLINHRQILMAVRTHQHSISVLEADNRVMQEMIDVYQVNIPFWTKQHLEASQLKLIWQLNFTPDVLSLKDFIEGIKVFRSVYVLLQKNSVDFYLKQERIIYLKRIWNFISREDFQNVRCTARVYVRSRNVWNIVGLLWMFSYISGILSASLWFHKSYKMILTRLHVREYVASK